MAETGDAISLRVYDLAGGLVRSLVNGFREAGTHTVPWDGEDESGRKVGSGVYFLRLANDREVLIGKAVVVR